MADEPAAIAPAEPVVTPAVPDSGAAVSPAVPDGGAASPVETPLPVETPAADPTPAAEDPLAGARDASFMTASEPAEKPAEAPRAEPDADTAKTDDPVDPAPAVEPLSYAEHELTLPEGVTFEAERLAEYDAILGQHRIPPEARQQLVDLYAGDVQKMVEQIGRDQYKYWENTCVEWRKDCAADPDFGGSRFDTSKAAAVRMIEFVLPEEERQAWNEFAVGTGAGSHPVMFRFLNRLAQRFGEPAQPPANIRPVAPQGTGAPRSLRNFYTRSSRRSG